MFHVFHLRLLLAVAGLTDGLQIAPPDVPRPQNGHWIDAWVSMPQLTEPANLPPAPFNGTSSVFPNTTVRQTIKMTTGTASHIRLRTSNAFGATDLTITSAGIALPVGGCRQNLTGASGVDTSTLQQITFSGNTSMTISPGALAVSDPVALPVTSNQVVSISLYLASGQQGFAITSHPGSRTTSWLSFGDQTSSSNFTDPSTQSTDHWYLISALEAWSPREAKSLVVVGDSITDGRGSTTNGNNRWPDQLFSRLQSPSLSNKLTKQVSISNQAAGGNRILADGLGPSGLSRIERDVLSHPHVSYAMIFEGVNDIGTAASTTSAQDTVYNRLVQAYRQIIARVHADGIPIFGATITPFGCENQTLQAYSTVERETTRQRINQWIRQSVGKSGGFDAVVDFDEMVRDGKNQTRLRTEFDSGDCLHLNPSGYGAMANGFPVDLFEQWQQGVSAFV